MKCKQRLCRVELHLFGHTIAPQCSVRVCPPFGYGSVREECTLTWFSNQHSTTQVLQDECASRLTLIASMTSTQSRQNGLGFRVLSRV